MKFLKLATSQGAAWRAFYLYLLDMRDTRDPRFPVYRKVCHLGFDPEVGNARAPHVFGSIGYEKLLTVCGRQFVPMLSFRVSIPVLRFWHVFDRNGGARFYGAGALYTAQQTLLSRLDGRGRR